MVNGGAERLAPPGSSAKPGPRLYCQRIVKSVYQFNHYTQVRVGVVGHISACHADASGSIPGHGVSNFFHRRRGFLLS